jgi:hypothetical protein
MNFVERANQNSSALGLKGEYSRISLDEKDM